MIMIVFARNLEEISRAVVTYQHFDRQNSLTNEIQLSNSSFQSRDRDKM